MDNEEPEENCAAISLAADQLNAAWERFEGRVQHFRIAASVPVEGYQTLCWGRFGGEWKLTVGDDRGGMEVRHAPLAHRIAAARAASALYVALNTASGRRLNEVQDAIAVLDAAVSS